jgi:hypothetical protein
MFLQAFLSNLLGASKKVSLPGDSAHIDTVLPSALHASKRFQESIARARISSYA